jgi:hypothetical protein
MIDGDDRIRNLVHAIAQASPPPPPLPTARARGGLGRGPIVGAAAFVVVVVTFVGLGSLLTGGAVGSGDDLIRAHSGGFRTDGMDAIVSGVVEVDLDDGCVWLTDPGGSRLPVVWPAGATATIDPFSIELRDGQRIEAGDLVEGGGGYIDALQASEWAGTEPFSEECLSTGEAAVFNAGSEITVTPDVGLGLPDTVVERFRVPEPIPLELIAGNGNARTLAVVDLLGATVNVYGGGDIELPVDTLDGGSGGGGFINLWADGNVYSYPGSVTAEPLVYRPDPLREIQGIAPTLEVVRDADGERMWLVQPAVPGDESTLVEVVNLVGLEVARLGSFSLDGTWFPIGTTIDGLIMTSDSPAPVTALVTVAGVVSATTEGTALSVGWDGAVVRTPAGDLVVTDPSLGSSVPVTAPGEGEWASVGRQDIPLAAPPIPTAGDSYLVTFANPAADSSSLVVVAPDGTATTLAAVGKNAVATWSRDGNWIALVDGREVSLVSLDGEVIELGALVPEDHWVITAG